MMAEEIRHATLADEHLSALTIYVINGWLSARIEVKELKLYWLF